MLSDTRYYFPYALQKPFVPTQKTAVIEYVLFTDEKYFYRAIKKDMDIRPHSSRII
jgi:hypothetical protein